MRTLPAPIQTPQPLPAEAGGPAAGSTDPALSDVPVAPLVLCAVALGCAVQVNFGQYHPVALAWVTVALAGF